MKFVTWKINHYKNGGVKCLGNDQSHQIHTSGQVGLPPPFGTSIKTLSSEEAG